MEHHGTKTIETERLVLRAFEPSDAAAAFMEGMAKSGEKPDALIMDPPRAGASARFLRAVAAAAPEKIAYVSCEPETLARDLAFLTRSGWRVRKIQPVDMFPHTRHIETVVLINRA